ncbi:MAG TPA: 16S rRNA (guanine(966)-N(2))-methyltransferase RsmD [Dehalococcoidia bacterium]|nr:16S rRNA (guanine(966)-N(2))-methyltransferase RsmD [Dehalococcoidia bacterium]
MRITGGSARGQIIDAPKNYDIRPTTDRTREAVFSMLASMGGNWRRCVDLYAGSGALGIEALSRGAEWVDFVDKERRCCDMIKQNLVKTGFSGQAKVYCSEVGRALTTLERKYDHVFMDPPYADTGIEDILKQLGAGRIMEEEAFLVVSHSSRVALKEAYGRMNLIKARRYGDTSISIYTAEGEN